jgi:integrase/recombinase XerD
MPVRRVPEQAPAVGRPSDVAPGAPRRRPLRKVLVRERHPDLTWGTLRPWVGLYTSYLLALDRPSGAVDACQEDLDHFFRDCEQRGLAPREVSRSHLLDYQAALAQGGESPSNRARKVLAVQRFFQFLADGGLLPRNPLAADPSSRTARRYLSEPEYRELRASARKAGPRAWAITELLLQTGLQASELCNLRRGDVTFSARGRPGLLLIRRGRGRRERVVPLNSAAEEALQAYLGGRGALGLRAPLFTTGRGAPLTRQRLGGLLGRLYGRLGLRGASAHTLRRTFATHSLRKGASLLVVKEVLGHGAPVSARGYLPLLQDTMCAEMEKYAL